MIKTNKQIINELTEYFMKQPSEVVCKMLAASMIDFNRIFNITELGTKEKNNLFMRMQHNLEQLHLFMQNGPEGNLILSNKNSDENYD